MLEEAIVVKVAKTKDGDVVMSYPSLMNLILLRIEQNYTSMLLTVTV